MKNKIARYTIEHETSQTISLPLGAKIISAQDLMGTLYLYALVEEEQNKEDFEIVVLGTWGTLPPYGDYVYVNTFIDTTHSASFHCFYRPLI